MKNGVRILLAVLGGLLSSLAALAVARVWPGRPAVLVNTAAAKCMVSYSLPRDGHITGMW